MKKLLQEKGGSTDPKAGPAQQTINQQKAQQSQQNLQQSANNIPPVKIE